MNSGGNIKPFLKKGDTVICMISEYRVDQKRAFDCTVQHVSDKGASVCYLSGYKSRNDDVPWADIVAKVDKTKPWVQLDDIPFSGSFHVFNHRESKD